MLNNIKWLSVLCVFEFAIICGLLVGSPPEFNSADAMSAKEQRITLFNKCMSMVPDTATDYADVVTKCGTQAYYMSR